MVGNEEWRRVRVVRNEEWRRVRVVGNEGSEERCWMIGSLLAGINENRSR